MVKVHNAPLDLEAQEGLLPQPATKPKSYKYWTEQEADIFNAELKKRVPDMEDGHAIMSYVFGCFAQS